MQHFLTIHDEDLGLTTPKPATYEERVTARAVVFDAGKNIALLHVSSSHYHKLPGGGMDEGETIEQALHREAMEEIGCIITNLREVGVIDEYRNGSSMHQTSYCFIAEVIGEKGTPEFDSGEIQEGMEPAIWVSLDDAIHMLESEVTVQNYKGKFINARELRFLKEAKKLT